MAAMILGLTATAVLIGTVPAAPMWLVLIGPFLVAGAGSGVVIGPNLTLALREVPASEGGAAAAVLQTGQRTGSAVGLAVTSSAFFGALTASHRHFPYAASYGLLCCTAFVVLALAVATADLSFTNRHRPGQPSRSPTATAAEHT